MRESTEWSIDDISRWKKVTVMGLGLFGGGAGVARFFAEQGADVTVTDAKDRLHLAESIAALDGLPLRFHLGGHREEDFINADAVVANQAVRPDNHLLTLARQNGIPVITETGLALALSRNPWIAVTGSSGKSTTASLAAEMLKYHDSETMLGGNIGGDLITRVTERPPGAPLVVELSSFQLIHILPDVAAGRIAQPVVTVITNITANHLDWHLDFAEYTEAKAGLARRQNAGQWTVINADDAVTQTFAASLPGRKAACSAFPGTPGGSFLDEDRNRLEIRLEGLPPVWFSLDGFSLIGKHNRYNALQAAAAAYAFCRDEKAVSAGLRAFRGLPHRLETAATVDGRLCINDSKATTPEAAILALEAVEGAVTIIAGGYDKLSPFEELGSAIQRRATGLVLLGVAGKRIGQAVAAAAQDRSDAMEALQVADCGDDFRKAVRTALTMTPPGGTVLLSPGCASYGMFVNYEQRGDRFREECARLGGQC